MKASGDAPLNEDDDDDSGCAGSIFLVVGGLFFCGAVYNLFRADGPNLAVGLAISALCLLAWKIVSRHPSGKIHGIEQLTEDQLHDQIRKGARFVQYEYAVSFLIGSMRLKSAICFIPYNRGRFSAGLKYSAVSLLFGLWALPWGPIYTFATIGGNMAGGENMTERVLSDWVSDSAEPAWQGVGER